MCRSRKNQVNSLNEEVYPNNAHSSDDEEDANVLLLHIVSLHHTTAMKTNGGRLWKWVTVHGNVINISQLQQVAPNAQTKKTKHALMSFSQHRMTPRGYTVLHDRKYL